MDIATPIASLNIRHAETFVARLFGLLARARLREDEALFLAPCSSVHTVGMRYSIDVAFVDRSGRVLKLIENLKPLRAAWCFGAYGAVELMAGGARRHGIRNGSLLCIDSLSKVPK